MSPPSDQYGDETYREEDDPYTEDEDRGWFPSYLSWGWGGALGGWPYAARREEETHYNEERYEGASDSPYDEDGSESLWDEGLATLLIAAGAILFLFPEPATSGLGILLMSIGVIVWFIGWAL